MSDSVALEDRSVASSAPPAKRAAQSPPPRQDEADLPLFEFTTRILRSPDEALELEAAWRRLSAVAVEPNAFYEPWALLPAWRNLAGGDRVELVVVEAPKRVFPTGPKVLCGLFPIVRRRSFYGLPVRCWELWRHVHCFATTPLVRRDCAAEVLDQFFTAAANDACAAPVVSAEMLAAEGPFQRLLVDSNAAAGRSVFTRGLTSRALFRAAVDAEAFLKASLSRKKRQGIQRTERRLAEQGALVTRWLGENDDLPEWIDAFLKLEAAGWKGRERTALACDAGSTAFFCEMLAGAYGAATLQMGRLDFDGKPIAMICNLLARDGGYSFKIAYDEALAEYSPGLLLELALIRELHARGVAWTDSCASSDHPMINHLWPERTLRQSLAISTGARGGHLATSLMPLMRWLKQKTRRRTRAAGADSQPKPAE